VQSFILSAILSLITLLIGLSKKTPLTDKMLFVSGLSLCLMGGAFFATILTNNESSNYRGFMVILLGICIWQIYSLVSYFGITRYVLGAHLFVGLLCFTAYGKISKFVERKVMTRDGHGLFLDWEYKDTQAYRDLKVWRKTLPVAQGQLFPMVWKLPSQHQFTESDLQQVINFVKNQPGNSIVIGYCSVIYGLAGKPSVFPSMSTAAMGSAYPLKGKEFIAFDEWVGEKMDKENVQWAIIEKMKEGWDIAALSSFPSLNKRFGVNLDKSIEFGCFRAIPRISDIR
jgi:hypothetical protein